MSTTTPPLTRSEWRDRLDTITTRLEPWIMLDHDETGEPVYILADNAPGPLADAYSRLLEYGYEHGWLTLEDDDTDDKEDAA